MSKPNKLVRFDWTMKRLLRSKASFGILEGFPSELLFRSGKIEGKAEGIMQAKQEIVLAMYHKHVVIDDIAMFVNLSN